MKWNREKEKRRINRVPAHASAFYTKQLYGGTQVHQPYGREPVVFSLNLGYPDMQYFCRDSIKR